MDFFRGSSKPKATTQSVAAAVSHLQGRADEVGKKIERTDVDLKKYKDQMSRMRDGAAKNKVKQRAMMVLKQKRMYEQQLASLQQQVFNLEQVNVATQNLKDSRSTMEAMSLGVNEMKKEYKKVDVGTVENLQEDIQDVLDLTDEVHTTLGRSYGAPEMDDDELAAELQALEDDDNLEDDDLSYLDALNTPAIPDHLPAAAASGRGKNPAQPSLATH